MKAAHLFLAIGILLPLKTLKAGAYDNCNEPISLDQVPQRIVTNDINNTEMVLALGAGDKIVATAAAGETSLVSPIFQDEFASIEEHFPSYMNPSTIERLRPDFIVGGWNYGFVPKTPLSPEQLKEKGVGAYVIKESCHIGGDYQAVTIRNSVFSDLKNLGSILGKTERAQQLLDVFSSQLDEVEKDVAAFGPAAPTRVFVSSRLRFRGKRIVASVAAILRRGSQLSNSPKKETRSEKIATVCG